MTIMSAPGLHPAMDDPNALNPYLKKTPYFQTHTIPALELENKTLLRNVPIAFHTWGQLNADKSNVLLICHAFSGSSDVSDWWGTLLGHGKVLDPTRFFIICLNCLGSPFGSASPVTINPLTGQLYGPDFPITSIRDDCHAFRHVLHHLGITQIQFVIGGSLGGMHVLEMAVLWGPEFVRRVIAIATCSYTSAWCISWNEVQRQCIFTDPNYQKGHYPINKGPKSGLAAARMQALLTYRTRDSFQARFARTVMHHGGFKLTANDTPSTTYDHVSLHQPHNEGSDHFTATVPHDPLDRSSSSDGLFSAQSYMRYQGDKFVTRFDANCYISITRKLDTHDILRGRSNSLSELITQPALILGVESDGLFTFNEQQNLAASLPNAELRVIHSNDGHDGFLLEFEQVGVFMKAYMHQQAPHWFFNPSDRPDSSNVEDVIKSNQEASVLNEPDFVAW